MNFKLYIKHFRLKRGLTQQELADKTGLSQMYISYLERDNRKKSPTLNTVAKIAEALEICPFSLIEFNCKLNCKYYESCVKRQFFEFDDNY